MKKRLPICVIVIAVILCIVPASVTACKKSQPSFTVGICQFAQHESLEEAANGFKAALTDQFGDQISFEDQNANGDYSVCTTITNELISKNVDLILADSTTALQIASTSTTTIPVLGTAVTDYGAALQLDHFDGMTGRNISGTSDLVPPEALADLMHELFPEAQKIGILYCSSETNSQYQYDGLKDELMSLGYTCDSYKFVDSGDLASSAEKAASQCDVIYIPTDNMAASNAAIIANICIPANIPVITGDENTCRICGTATLSVNYYDLGYATGEMAAQVLRGEKDISEIPVQYAQSFTKKYNEEICRSLGISIPDDYIPLTNH
ncbi:MAG: ABC transporter substrate-binding protein [Schaedlerella sp.]|nr:ABC transporter substrate-binding protein [Clostridiales bacterium]MDY3746554.1 ABC transporter substrate-binding protein [Lachnospiraceae bacterium]MDY4201799.1 ABC transporter substrate-binding protein [Schaedlerella sp.]